MTTQLGKFLIAAMAIGLSQATLSRTIVYENDFSVSAGPEWSRSILSYTPIGSRRFLGQFSNDRVTLTLSNLPPHATADIAFDLFIIQTWDGNLTGGTGPDIWQLSRGNGTILLRTTFNTQPEFPAISAAGQAFPDQYDPIAPKAFAPFTGAAETNTLGFLWGEGIKDAVYHIQTAISHTNRSLTLEFSGIGLQGVGDEGWGLDNVVIEVSGPGPSFTRQPQSAEAKLGDTVVFSSTVTGTGSLRYQWRFNGARIIGGVNPTLTINQVTAFDEGDYTVEVTDDLGSVSSTPAHLYIFRDSDGDGLSDNFEKGVGRYEIVKGDFTWNEAKADAEKRGGHLATITSQAEYDFLVGAFGNQMLAKWLGATDESIEGEWKWVTGEPWTFTIWDRGQPDNGGGRQDYLWFHSDFELKWDDNFEDMQIGYILERGFATDPNNADTDGDGIQDGEEYDAGSLPTDRNSRPLPKVVSPPQGTNLVAGGTISLGVNANGFGPLTYQWRLNGQPIPNATNETLTIANSQHTDSGRYDVVLKNTVGAVISANALVRITPVVDVQRLDNGFIILQLLDSRPLNWQVESSENLITWQSLGNMTYTDGLGVFLDATASGKTRRFYRIVSP